MMQACADPDERIALGAYMLGALDPADRARIELHLSSCPACQDEAGSLADVAARLSSLSPALAEAAVEGEAHRDDGPGGCAPSGQLATVTRIAARRRRGWRSAALPAAAAAVVAIAAVAAIGIGDRPAPLASAGSQSAGQSYGTPAGPWQAASAASGGATATVMWRPMGWGTQVQAKVSGIAPGTRCQLAVVTAAGQREAAGSWTADAAAGQVVYPGSAEAPAGDIRSFVITVAGRPAITVRA
jgi:hypothetical protein